LDPGTVVVVVGGAGGVVVEVVVGGTVEAVVEAEVGGMVTGTAVDVVDCADDVAAP